MRRIAPLAVLFALAAPSVVAAQAGLELSAPVAYERAPAAPSAAARLSTEAQPRWPSRPQGGVDPELLAIWAGGSPRGQATLRDEPRRRGPSFGASLGHAAGGFGIGVAVGGLTGGGIAGAACNGTDWCGPLALTGGVLGAMALAPAGAALGAWGFGELAGGTGNAFAALGGAYLGAGVGAGLSALFAMAGEGVWAAVFAPALGVVLSMLGAAGGYQLTSHGAAEPPDPAQGPRTIALPTLSPTDDGQGATVGAVGTF